MFIRVTASGSSPNGFVIGTKPMGEFQSSVEGKALAYVLSQNLPHHTLKALYQSLKPIATAHGPNMDYYVSKLRECAEKVEV